MKRLLTIIASLMLLASLSSCASSSKTPVRSPDSLHSHIGESTVALVAQRVVIKQDKETGEIESASVVIRPYCTGVWISNDEILTAGHCVQHEEGADPVDEKIYYVVQKEVKEVLDDPAALHLGKVVAFDEDHDLALIKANAGGLVGHEVASLAGELPGLGEHVYSVGHPRGMYWTYAEGTISAYRNESDVGKVIQVNATIWFGNSGGGIFDGSGNLLGICSRLTKVPQMNYYVHLDSVKKFVKEFHAPAEDLSKK